MTRSLTHPGNIYQKLYQIELQLRYWKYLAQNLNENQTTFNIKGFIIANKIDEIEIDQCLKNLEKNYDSQTAFSTRISVLEALQSVFQQYLKVIKTEKEKDQVKNKLLEINLDKKGIQAKIDQKLKDAQEVKQNQQQIQLQTKPKTKIEKKIEKNIQKEISRAVALVKKQDFVIKVLENLKNQTEYLQQLHETSQEIKLEKLLLCRNQSFQFRQIQQLDDEQQARQIKITKAIAKQAKTQSSKIQKNVAQLQDQMKGNMSKIDQLSQGMKGNMSKIDQLSQGMSKMQQLLKKFEQQNSEQQQSKFPQREEIEKLIDLVYQTISSLSQDIELESEKKEILHNLQEKISSCTFQDIKVFKQILQELTNFIINIHSFKQSFQAQIILKTILKNAVKTYCKTELGNQFRDSVRDTILRIDFQKNVRKTP